MLTDGEITSMRETAETTFDSTAVIQAQGWVSDGGGGGTTTWTAAGTVPCHISPMPPLEVPEPEVGERITPNANWVVTLPAETEIDRESRIVVAGTTYEVAAIKAPRTWELTRRLEVTEVT
jgi:hypothetical protein